MKRKRNLLTYLSALRRVNRENVGNQFTALFAEGCDLLGLSDEEAARRFEAPVSSIRRWRTGKSTPPAAVLVLRFMTEEGERYIRSLLPILNTVRLQPRYRPLRYFAVVHPLQPGETQVSITFPGLVGCHTCSSPKEGEPYKAAKAALELWLEASLDAKVSVSKPGPGRGANLAVDVNRKLSSRLWDSWEGRR